MIKGLSEYQSAAQRVARLESQYGDVIAEFEEAKKAMKAAEKTVLASASALDFRGKSSLNLGKNVFATARKSSKTVITDPVYTGNALEEAGYHDVFQWECKINKTKAKKLPPEVLASAGITVEETVSYSVKYEPPVGQATPEPTPLRAVSGDDYPF